MHISDVVTALTNNQLLVALVGAVIAAFLAYVLGLRSQAKLLKTQTKLHMYDDFWDAKNNLSNAVVEYHVALMGIPTQLVTMRYANSSKETLKGITTKSDSFTKSARNCRSSSTALRRSQRIWDDVWEGVMYPKLDTAFKLLADENQKLFNAQLELVGELYKPDAIALLDPKNEEVLMKTIEASGCVEMCADMIAYIIDFFALIQKELAGNLFKFKIDERKPIQGQVLTKKGWKPVKKKKD